MAGQTAEPGPTCCEELSATKRGRKRHREGGEEESATEDECVSPIVCHSQNDGPDEEMLPAGTPAQETASPQVKSLPEHLPEEQEQVLAAERDRARKLQEEEQRALQAELQDSCSAALIEQVEEKPGSSKLAFQDSVAECNRLNIQACPLRTIQA